MTNVTRRNVLKSVVSGAAMASISSPLWSANTDSVPRKGRVKQSVSRWCYKNIPLDDLCTAAAQMGLKAVDLLNPDEFEVPARYGLVCSMGYAGGGEIGSAMNRVENHARIEEGFRKFIPLAAKAGVPNVITFSGLRAGMSDDEGAKNTIIGLNRVKKIGEDHGVTICMELLNSKVDHKDYMCDHSAWGVRVVEEVNSPRVKLLYDIYHMQIMEGDLVRTIQQNIQWHGVMRGIVAANFQGYVAHEFVPTRDPLTSLRQAVDLCDV
jgi:hydroxypyruvate isomerase